MRTERICSLSRHIIALSTNPYMTHAVQWFERTLDDSAGRRISIPESFLTADAILELMYNVTDGLVVYEKMIEKHVMEELPFMATENIIMEAVKKGASRQDMHGVIRENSMKAASQVKNEGLENDLLKMLAEDSRIPLNANDINNLLNPSDFTGRAESQVEDFIDNEVEPLINKYQNLIGMDVDIKV
jgi:adenylosuccinate lyase